MAESGTLIHVDRQVVQAGANTRNVLAATFGLAADAPSTVTTGCGQQVPGVLTSPRPESVSCPACRDHARREHLAFADQVERLTRMPGSAVSSGDGAKAARHHRALAEKFA
ncbi:hypothetical protein [Actinoplanes sp. N902-109]|uniref:hypothetical protein n=1 Tax=Actinoplanes sp. (strain N902-109) TaxID=649831 RepID=UPI00032956F7|nr:hypothetical protein [Actinoplanes sp. N902-109]AGL14928.1 hypothetical protein L083_1418 [Actinoplanes sp. N902-109]